MRLPSSFPLYSIVSGIYSLVENLHFFRCFYRYPVLFDALAGRVPIGPWYEVGVKKLQSLCYP